MCCCFANVMSPKLLCFIGELSDTEHVMVMNHRTYWTHAWPQGNESRLYKQNNLRQRWKA